MQPHSFKKILSLGALLIVVTVGMAYGHYRLLGIESYFDLALYRLLGAFLVGASLSLTGFVLQSVFQNELAEPYTLGISSGASLGAVVASAFFGGMHFLNIQVGSAIGGLTFSGILVLLMIRSQAGAAYFLLTGMMLGLLGSSGVALIYAMKDPAGIFGALHWLLGDISRMTPFGCGLIIVFLLPTCWYTLRHSREIELLRFGDELARSMGVDVRRVRRELLLFSALLVSVTVAWAGIVGFVGLMIPHFVRSLRLRFETERVIAVTFLGGTALVFADVLGRVLFFPVEVPIGVITTLIGAPWFIVFLYRRGWQG